MRCDAMYTLRQPAVIGMIGTMLLAWSFSAAVYLPASADETAATKKSPASEEDWFRPEADAPSLRQELKEEQLAERWIYHDLDAAREKARETGKPILAVFRCVPCGSAPGLDGAVCTAGGAEAWRFENEIRAAGGDLSQLLDQFVAVRMVKMNGVNRHVFSFDRDVPYVAIVLNADGVVYGRYGTRISNDRKNLPRHNLSSFQNYLRRTLRLHDEQPQPQRGTINTASPAFAEDLPSFKPFPAEHNPVVKNCIHCHTVGEAELRHKLQSGDLALRDVWPFPLPQNLGLTMDVNDGLLVESVHDNSMARQAGIQPRDVLLKIGDQPLTSEADIQWVLHHAPDKGSLPVELRRGDQTIRTHIELQDDWRRTVSDWRESLTPLRPDLHLRPDPHKLRKGVAPDQMALTIHYPRGAAAQAGLRNGDLLVAVNGITTLHHEADVLRYIYFGRPDATSIELTILREGNRSTVTLPLQPSATRQ